MKRIFKWLFRLFLAAVVLVIIAVVVLFLSYNALLRVVIERQAQKNGFDVDIGSLNVSLFRPVVEIKDFKVRNSPEFGGTTFFDLPEIHVEYDRDALAHRELHFKLVRVNLGELDIVKNQAGKTNIFMGNLKVPAKPSGGGNPLADFKKQSGFDFTGIDELNVSIGKMKYIDLGNQRNNREQDIGIDELVIPHVKTRADLIGLAADIALRSNGFFESVFGQKQSSLDTLKQLGL